jgi:protoporphyrinogen/coproporphyrinogen III oxidase
LRVVVVGGGLAGLFTASELVAAGVDDVVVVDAAEHPGGITRTIVEDGYSLEPAAGSFPLPHPALSPILERCDIDVVPARDASTRHVFVGGRLVPLRPGPGALLAPLVSLRAKASALAEPLRGRRSSDGLEESLAGFLRRRLGAGAGDMIAWLMASGVFAGDPERLSAEAAFPLLEALEREHGSLLLGGLRSRRARSPQMRPGPHVPVGGMTALAESLARSLDGRFRGGFAVAAVRRGSGAWEVSGPETITADAVVLAVRPETASELLGEDVGGGSAPVFVVGLGGKGAPLPEGFGLLVGPGEGLATRGVLFESSYAPSRAPHGSWLAKVIVGGAGGRVPDGDDESVISVVGEELGRILSSQLKREIGIVVRHLDGIPQYDVGHRAWLQEVDALLRDHPGVFVTGWGYRGVGVVSLAMDAARMARAISSTSTG